MCQWVNVTQVATEVIAIYLYYNLDKYPKNWKTKRELGLIVTKQIKNSFHVSVSIAFLDALNVLCTTRGSPSQNQMKDVSDGSS